MKIFIIGAHGAGKTTLVNSIKRELEKEEIPVIVVPELARFMLENLKFDWRLVSFSDWVNFQKTLMEYYYFAHRMECDLPLISDRSLLDVYAYCKYAAGRWRIHIHFYYPELLEEVYGKIKRIVSDEENYFYLYSMNGNWKEPSQQRIEEYLREILNEMGIQYKIFIRSAYREIKKEITKKIKKYWEGKRDENRNRKIATKSE